MASVRKRRGARFRSGMIGLALFAVAGFALYVALTAQQGLPFVQHAFRNAAVNDVGDLTVGNDVRIAQVRVGRVDRITLQGSSAVVRMQLDDGATKVWKDATASVIGRSGLGQQYLELQPGTPEAGELGESDVLPVGRSRDAVQLLDLAGVFDPDTQVAGRSLLQQVGGGLAGHGQDLHDFAAAGPTALPSLGTVSTTLAADDGRDLTSMLTSLRDLTARFDGRQDEIASLVGQLDTTFAAVNADNGKALGDTLVAATDALPAVRGALDDLHGPLTTTTSALTQLAPGTAALGDATPDVRGVLREAPAPLDKVPGVADSAKPALAALTPALADARPLSAKLRETVGFAQEPLSVLAPYSPEIAQWFTNAAYALSDGDAAGHWLRFTLIPRTESVSGNGNLIKDPLTVGDPYPAAGQVPDQQAGLPLNLGGNR